MATPTWNFPFNNDGREDGLNDPGIETFRNDPLRSLAREIVQNSLDAGDPETGKAVEVHFSLEDWPRSRFPDGERFAETLAHCAKYWKDNESAQRFFGRAQKIMRARTVRVLKVQDFNTIGLLGPFADRTSHWFKLTKAVGVSDKMAGAGGSFGIGKHAPFACSDLRTVLYGTRDKHGDFAFQGVSKLVTHIKSRQTTQGTGYYGLAQKNSPITDPEAVDKAFRRSQTGTDIYVLGFLLAPEWADQIVEGLIESFLVAIYQGTLVARVGDTLVNRASLEDLVAEISRTRKNWLPAAYYRSLTSEDAHRFVEDDFAGLGMIELRAITGSDLPKRIAMVRSTGMKIYDKGNFQTPIRFAGVLSASGEELNALLRSLEPPSHDKWVPERAEDKAQARDVLKRLNTWLHEKIRLLGAGLDVEELDAEGVSQFLPDDIEEDVLPSTDAASEGERNEPAPEIHVALRPYQPQRQRGAAISDVGADDGESSTFDEGEEHLGNDDVEDDGGAGGTRDTGNRGDEHGGAGDPGGPAPRRIGLRNVRVFCVDERVGRYRIICRPEESGAGFLNVRVIGEVGQDAAPIKEFGEPGAPPQKPERLGVIGPLQLSKDRKLELDVLLDGALHCALAVTAHVR